MEKTVEYMKTHPRLWKWSLWLLWALLYGMCFPTYNLGFLMWIIFVPVLVFAYTMPLKETLFYGFFASLVFWLFTTYWLVAFHEFSLPFVSPSYALYYAFFFFCIAYFGRKVPRWRFLSMPAFWVMNEFLRSSGFLGFKWNLIADSQYAYPVMIQTADLWGQWGITFIILLVNAALAELVISWLETGNFMKAVNYKRLPLSVAGASLLFLIVYGIFALNYYQNVSEEAPTERIALMQPNVQMYDDWFGGLDSVYFPLYQELHEEAAEEGAELIVWTEAMIRHFGWYYYNMYDHEQNFNRFTRNTMSFAWDYQIPIWATHPEMREDGKAQNTSELIDPFVYSNFEHYSSAASNFSEFSQNYAKVHLAPFGEWVPYIEHIKPVYDWLQSLGAASYAVGEKFTIFQTTKSKFGAMICFDDIYPALYRRYVKTGVNFFLNGTNDGWAYRWALGTGLPLWQHVAEVTFTSVALRRPVARAVNTGVTCVIDCTGEIDVSDIPLYESGVYVTDISIIPEDIVSVYVRFGYLFPYLMILVSLAAMVYAVFFVDKPIESLY